MSANERVQTNAAGQVVLKLKTPWRDGTTHLVMSPPASATMNSDDLIEIRPGVRSGKPCFKGTRITVYDVLEYMAGGMTQQEMLDNFPALPHAAAHAAAPERLHRGTARGHRHGDGRPRDRAPAGGQRLAAPVQDRPADQCHRAAPRWRLGSCERALSAAGPGGDQIDMRWRSTPSASMSWPRPRGQRAGEGQLLLLAARQIAAAATDHLLEHREQLEQPRRHGRALSAPPRRHPLEAPQQMAHIGRLH